MGAQTEQRLEQFKKRFEEWDDPHNETPPYHYGTHYSSAMIVSSYLVRLEPFTQHFLRLQGGHFDLADRMFHSVEEAWESASKNNMADLRDDAHMTSPTGSDLCPHFPLSCREIC